ncbi:hypothetical protein [Azospirillum rugosum]|uniref:Transposase IS66 family protein n=1 Tax=Azospirillum rugosum TaxID=416170 RepID=A0ABS4SW49_9PROT|nr:hypothetical protein [Azospirillum rugosum]MBP2296793.1 hypothetical protein [Azospirillum rugosum]MDQ0530396.1 hypothetical protein [Azospirillum rugosum]
MSFFERTVLPVACAPERRRAKRLATEAAVWGSIQEHGLLPHTVIVSDDAGQFDVGRHALCWVHAERLVHKLDTFTPAQYAAQQRIRALIWWFYADLKTYRTARHPPAHQRLGNRHPLPRHTTQGQRWHALRSTAGSGATFTTILFATAGARNIGATTAMARQSG